MQTNALIFGPIAVALLLWLLPFTPRLAGGIALSASIATLIGWIGAVAQFDFKDGQTSPARLARRLAQGRRHRLPRRDVRLLPLADRAHRGRHHSGDRLRDLDPPRSRARLLRAPALPGRNDDRRVRRAGPHRLLRLLRGDADPALRADRRVGRRRSPGRDAQVHRLHDGGLAAHARLDHRARPPEGDVRHDRAPRRRTTRRSSSASWSRSPSRRRCGRSTAGCPTPTAKPRPRWPRSSRA